ncbi:MAG: hypothetical protein EGS53_07845, partial [Prevotella sp.]|nr:hypothetical protein [Prevotella sp.]
VSILLLYKTLISQNRSFKQERFEITFFNLLDQRQKAVDSLFFRCEELKGVDFVFVSYHGEECFEAICREMNCLKEALYGKKYLGMIFAFPFCIIVLGRAQMCSSQGTFVP